MVEKILNVLVIAVLLLIIIGSTVNAAELKTRLDIVQTASETKQLENAQGYLSKTILDTNASTGEVTIELKLANMAKEIEKQAETEIFLVIDNSPSMDFVTPSGETRKEIVINSAKKLVESIYKVSSNVNVGLIDFHGAYLFESANIINATVKQRLTDNKDSVITALDSLLISKTQGGTNIDAGLERAYKNFSTKQNNKVVILLTDGIPTSDTKGNNEGKDITTEKGLTIQDNTKQTILKLKSEGIYTITMLTGMNKDDGNTDKNGNVFDEDNTIEEKLAAAERIFGTTTNPTADKYYLVKSANIDSIINNDILQDVSSKISSQINNVKIVDYFPADITENFDFSYVGDPSIGTKTNGIDANTKTITWNIGTLKSNETASLKYKLKIKDMKNTKILNKTIATNEKVVLTYNDVNSKAYTVELTNSPKIKLSEIKEETNATPTPNPNNKPSANDGTIDTTTAKGEIPKTGVSLTIAFAIAGASLILLVVHNKKNKYKEIK